MKQGLIYPEILLKGSEQMALDVILMDKCIKESRHSLIIRLYKSENFWLSIGKNQTSIPSHWIQIAKDKKIEIVRRPSGGKAVLHGAGLTYSLIWQSPPKKKQQAYKIASQWLITAFEKMQLPLKFGSQASNSLSSNCFATSTIADLTDMNNQKLIGSAQLWRKGTLLQHGEILLFPPKALWEEIFKTKPPKTFASSDFRRQLTERLYKSCMSYWPEVSWENGTLNDKDLSELKIKSLNYLPLLGNQ